MCEDLLGHVVPWMGVQGRASGKEEGQQFRLVPATAFGNRLSGPYEMTVIWGDKGKHMSIGYHLHGFMLHFWVAHVWAQDTVSLGQEARGTWHGCEVRY